MHWDDLGRAVDCLWRQTGWHAFVHGVSMGQPDLRSCKDVQENLMGWRITKKIRRRKNMYEKHETHDPCYVRV